MDEPIKHAREIQDGKHTRLYFTDGSALPPEYLKAGWGMHIQTYHHTNNNPDPNKENHSGSLGTNIANDGAELAAILAALKHAMLHCKEGDNIHIFPDCQPAIQLAMDGIEQMKSCKTPYWATLKAINKLKLSIRKKNVRLQWHWIPGHLDTVIPEEEISQWPNGIADRLAQTAAHPTPNGNVALLRPYQTIKKTP